MSEQHVEVRDSRISRDDSDVEKVSEWLSINYPFPNTNCLMSIATGISGNDNVNCHKAYEIGIYLVNTMVGNNFHDIKLKRSSKVTNLASITSGVKINEKIIKINPLLLFQRIAILKKNDYELFIKPSI